MKNKPFLLFVIFLCPLLGCAQQNPDFPVSEAEQLVDTISLDFKNPWSFTFLPDGAILVTEKEGTLHHLKDGIKQDIGGLPDIYVRGQGGFLDITLHPDYANNGWIYFSYGLSKENSRGGNTAVMRARLQDMNLSDQQVIFEATPESTKGQHWGGRLTFDKEGFLYISVGDRGSR
ncbi:MAG: PQQ-dependent sugar dehydrogenase, partial [Saprospiraceae bacterium]|nr:PQQ-dependent sugar dehydrogenase [Saprospiraceae bacterium]